MKIGDQSIAFRRKVEGDDEKEVRVRCVELRREMGFTYTRPSSAMAHKQGSEEARPSPTLRPQAFREPHLLFACAASATELQAFLASRSKTTQSSPPAHIRHTTNNKQNLTWFDVRVPAFGKLRHSNSVVMEDHVNLKRAWKLAIQG